jgi:genome maintenance exonuclease 1
MIEQNENLETPRVKRIVHPDPTARRITLEDGRFYQRKEGVYYPSVTTVLSYFPKDRFFETWLKEVGTNADIIMRRAGDEGTQVHTAIESYLKGEEVTWVNQYGSTKYSLKVWQMILKFVEFWETYKPTLVASEVHVFSDELQIAGTADLVVEMNDELWLLDIKTSNFLHESYDLQLACYAQAWNECFDKPIQRMGIVWLKAMTRGESKKADKMQGKGWEVKEPKESFETNKQVFKHLFEIFKFKNPELKPITEILPTSVKLKE